MFSRINARIYDLDGNFISNLCYGSAHFQRDLIEREIRDKVENKESIILVQTEGQDWYEKPIGHDFLIWPRGLQDVLDSLKGLGL